MQELPTAGAGSEPRGTIFVVDDNADMRQSIVRLLSANYEVMGSKGLSGWPSVLGFHSQLLPDMVLTDVMMPNLDGFGLLRELPGNPETRMVPTTMLSALNDTGAGVGVRLGGMKQRLHELGGNLEVRSQNRGLRFWRNFACQSQQKA
jgi:CheY-like chemotaxis protein